MLNDDADIRELIREWNIFRSSQELEPITGIRRISQSSLDMRPESEHDPKLRTESGSVNRQRRNTFLRKELVHVNRMRNDMRSSSCDLIDPSTNPPCSRLSSGDEQRGKHATSLPVLTPPPSIERLRSPSSDTATSILHRRTLVPLHPTLRAPLPGSASPNELPPYTATQTGRTRPSGAAAAAASFPPASLGPPDRAPPSLTGRLLGTLSRPATIRRAAAGRQPQAGLCFIWNRGRRPADFAEPERTASEAARRAEAAHAR